MTNGGIKPAIWIDPEYLTKGQKEKLRKTLDKSKLTEEQKEDLLNRCGCILQLQPETTTTAAVEAKQLEKIEASAHGLLNNITALSDGARDSLSLHGRDYLLFPTQGFYSDFIEHFTDLGRVHTNTKKRYAS